MSASLRALALLALLPTAPASAAEPALPSTDVPLKLGLSAPDELAVVIGLEHYLDLPAVPYAERDAKAFYDFLVYTRGLDPANVKLMTDKQSRAALVRALQELAARTTDRSRPPPATSTASPTRS